MARESSVSDTEQTADTGSAEPPGTTGLLPRRSYLKLAGGAAVATALSSAASADEDYDVVEAQGQTIRVGQGETYENKLIDVSGGGDFLILIEGGDSVVRNIGFRGLFRGSSFIISITAGQGDVLIENIYLGDGATKEGESFVHGPGAVFMHRQSNVDVTFRRCNVQGYPNNGFYCSNTATGGSARFERCFGKNNGVSTFRCASGSDEIVDCVAYNDATDYGPGYGGYIETDGRPVWVWNGGTVTIRDSEFAAGTYPYAMVAGANGAAGRVAFESGGYDGSIQRASGSSVDIDDGVSTSPSLDIPDGVPTSPEAAAAGRADTIDDEQMPSEPEADEDESETDDSEELPNVILFDGEPTDVSRYEFVVSGDVEKSTYDGASIDDEDVIEDEYVHGVVADWKDAFRFDGELEQLTVDGPATVVLNDESIDPDEYGVELPHVLDVTGSGEPASYELTVDGTIDHDEETADDDITVSGSTVEGSIGEGSHRFLFSGALTDVTVTAGSATIALDGEELDLTEYDDTEFLAHALVIDGTNAGPSTYSFEIDGAVVKSEYLGATIDDEDVIDGTAVRGGVAGWLDAYWFDGDIQDFRLVGDASVDVQYNARDR